MGYKFLIQTDKSIVKARNPTDPRVNMNLTESN